MHLLQVCNVGNICGGTAACAWTITRALPHCQHSVWFLSSITPETREAFSHCRVERIDRVTAEQVRRSGAALVLLHNTSSARVEPIRTARTVMYHHSAGNHAAADLQWCCSQWLQAEMKRDVPVLYQPVPIPHHGSSRITTRSCWKEELVVGRLNTPHPRKWPRELIPFYECLAKDFPQVAWEFVGAPADLRVPLTAACRGRATFLPAEWEARRHFWRWDALLYHHPRLTESFGRTVSEAQRVGCIPLVDRRGGFQEQIEHTHSGWLCDGVKGFEAGLAALHDPAQRWRISHAARDSAEARCSLRGFAERFSQAVLT